MRPIASFLIACVVIAILAISAIILTGAKADAKDILQGPYEVTNISVYDGDTFKGDVKIWPGLTVRVGIRIKGIDTPELRGKCGLEIQLALAAKDKLMSLLLDKVMIEEVHNGKYAGRVVAHVVTETADVGFEMIKSGLARQYTGKGARGSWCK